VASMGCCTSLLYGPTGASEKTVKGQLTLIFGFDVACGTAVTYMWL
jgi:hypothetical protein